MNKKWTIISTAGVFVVAVAVIIIAFSGQGKKIVSKLSNKITSKKIQAKCPIDGASTTAEKAEAKPLGIMIENLKSIRPQNGLSKACMVFEALAEGGITRFLTIFNHNDADRIGPVRSTRPYYVALAAGFDAVYAHAGGSTEGIQKIQEYGIDDLGYENMNAYWRQSGISAPHNLFTSTAKLRTEAEKKGFVDADYTGFQFSKKKIKGARAGYIKIDFSYDDYLVEYRYDSKTNRYNRFNAGLPHKDANTGRQIAPSNIVVVTASTSNYNPTTLNIKIIGQGDGYLFRDGRQIPIKWEKESADTQIVFKDLQDNEVKLAPGQTWVEIVKPDTPVKFH